MDGLIKGDVVVVPFPFSDLSGKKRRPALVVLKLNGDDLILCQITGQNKTDAYAVSLTATDFKNGALGNPSTIRPNKIFTSDKNIVIYKIGNITEDKINQTINGIIAILNN
jgi:mRNA interferase MazF